MNILGWFYCKRKCLSVHAPPASDISLPQNSLCDVMWCHNSVMLWCHSGIPSLESWHTDRQTDRTILYTILVSVTCEQTCTTSEAALCTISSVQSYIVYEPPNCPLVQSYIMNLKNPVPDELLESFMNPLEISYPLLRFAQATRLNGFNLTLFV